MDFNIPDDMLEMSQYQQFFSQPVITFVDFSCFEKLYFNNYFINKYLGINLKPFDTGLVVDFEDDNMKVR